MSNIPAQTHNYFQFMSLVGIDLEERQFLSQLPLIFTEDIIKNENGKTIVAGQEQLITQLRNARNYAFPWTMEITNTVCDTTHKVAAIQFTWNSEKVGLHITTAILKFDEDNKINEIIEVYNKFADITH